MRNEQEDTVVHVQEAARSKRETEHADRKKDAGINQRRCSKPRTRDMGCRVAYSNGGVAGLLGQVLR